MGVCITGGMLTDTATPTGGIITHHITLHRITPRLITIDRITTHRIITRRIIMALTLTGIRTDTTRPYLV